MDEATASIDYTSDTHIQQTIRELKNTTIITIAHRLQSIIDYDKVLVLDGGKIVEFGNPRELLDIEQSRFGEMCRVSGDWDMLPENLDEKVLST
jgi:ABC-type multidrug transport system fused ATPase/permease subunit